MRKIITITAILILLIATVGFAEETPGYFQKFGEYHFDGEIDWTMRSGSSTTGAEHVFKVQGEGAIKHADMINMEQGQLEVASETGWVSYGDFKSTLTVISAIKVGMPPLEDVYLDNTKQIYAAYLAPAYMKQGYMYQDFAATHGSDFIDSLSLTFEGMVEEGVSRRFASLSSTTSETRYEDYFVVSGYAEFKESLKLYDVEAVLTSTSRWQDLF